MAENPTAQGCVKLRAMAQVFALAICTWAISMPVLAAEITGDGAADAQAAIAAREFRIHRVGTFGVAGGGHRGLDPATGFPVFENGLGCLTLAGVEAMERRYVQEFNAVIMRHVRQHGLPPESRKRWLADLNKPQHSFAKAQIAARKPDAPQMVQLTLDGPKATSEEGVSIRIVSVETKDGDKITKSVRLVITRGVFEVGSHPWNKSLPVDLFFGPKESDTAYIRWPESHPAEKQAGKEVLVYATLDLRSGAHLATDTAIRLE